MLVVTLYSHEDWENPVTAIANWKVLYMMHPNGHSYHLKDQAIQNKYSSDLKYDHNLSV